MADVPYKADSEIVKMMEELIREHHPDLLDVMDGIALLFKEKASKSGGKVVYGKTSKAPAIMKAITGEEWYFVITLSQEGWVNLTHSQRLALLDHHLCACRVDWDESTGEYKHFVASPDFVGFRDEVERHGLWRPDDEDSENASSTTSKDSLKDSLMEALEVH